MQKAALYFNDIRLKPSQIHKLRGYVGNLFAEHDLIHNHDLDTGRTIYRYPLIQFKIINNTPCIIALTEKTIQALTQIFMNMDEMIIAGNRISIHEKDLKVEDTEFGFSEDVYAYQFPFSPWIALNQNNYKKYRAMKTEVEKKALLERILIGNILSMSKYLGVHLETSQTIKVGLQVTPSQVNLKGKQMIGFKGVFKTNFRIPDDLGIGKAVSRGYGTLRKLI